MSRNCPELVMPGWGRQSRAVGAHGNTESNGATGSWAFNPIEAAGPTFQLTLNSQMFSASDVAPYGPPSSWVPTSGIGALALGSFVPSMSAGSSPSPVRLIGIRVEAG